VISFGYLELTRDSQGTWQGAAVAVNPANWPPFLTTPPTAGQALCVKPMP
jgi:hypothetical protein